MELTEPFLAKIAGWEAMKRARGLVAAGAVLSSNWTPPHLKGLVQEGPTAYRAGLVIKDALDLENLCSCREARRWGAICAHSVAVGLHHLHGGPSDRAVASSPAPLAPRSASLPGASARPGRRLLRAATGGRGEPLELCIILPPNFAQALGKGRIMLCLEGKWSAGRVPLNALPTTQAYDLSDQEAALLTALEELAGGDTPGLLQLSLGQFAALLPQLAGHPRVTLGKTQPLAIKRAPWRLALQASLETSGQIRLTLKSAAPTASLSDGETGWVFTQGALQSISLPKSCWQVLHAPITLSRSQVPQFLNQDWSSLEASCELEANFRPEDFSLVSLSPRFRLHLTGGLAQLQAQLHCLYATRTCLAGVLAPDGAAWLPDPQCPTRYSARDFALEQAALARLIRSGFRGPNPEGQWQLAGQNSVLNFLAREFPRLQQEWEVTLEERLERTTAEHLERLEPQFQVTPAGEQWFDLQIHYTTPSGEQFAAADIQRLLLCGQSHQRLKNGRIALLDSGAVEELQEVLLDCAPQQHPQGYRLQNQQAAFLMASIRETAAGTLHAPAQWLESAAHLGAPPSAPPLGELETVLRPYQKQGVAWLHWLDQRGFGGILADEMGLGKTIQTLAFLQTLKDAHTKAAPLPALVICPTSLVFNWLMEAKKFTPNLRLLALEGPRRHDLFPQIPQNDLVITSYALVRRDTEFYRPLEFGVVVLDEAQHIKNRQTENAQAVKSIRARQRLVLTGTPLENSVLDLWSLFDFLMPGYLGAAQDFRERYELPISRQADGPAQTRLARRLRPFLLRRLKREVAPELPAKLEQISFCELTAEQAGVYRQVLEASRQEIVQAVGAQGLAKSRLLIFTALLRLRQICCDLRLLDLPFVDPANASGKLELLRELLAEVLDGGHRVLVFSQFVSMLALLREQLTADGLAFSYLDGATPNRAEVVAQFQDRPDIPVFLISLKAGGVGLNLAAADTVVHFDPWWNPAVEDQAADRAHRLGQTRVVTSYKLIARGTVEEKILHLQSRKRAVIAAALGVAADPITNLDWDQIQELFRD